MANNERAGPTRSRYRKATTSEIVVAFFFGLAATVTKKESRDFEKVTVWKKIQKILRPVLTNFEKLAPTSAAYRCLRCIV
jgi:hypothetical protein